MAGDEGVKKSSNAVSQPLENTVAGSSRPVFISYTSQDVAVAQKVCAALEGTGFGCWMAPRNVIPGTRNVDGIVHAIDEASILVHILSAQAVASAHVGREIKRAVSKRHPVVALRIDGAPLTAAFEYFLNQSQWVRPDRFPTRLNVALERPNDGTGMYRLGKIARHGVMRATAVGRKDSALA